MLKETKFYLYSLIIFLPQKRNANSKLAVRNKNRGQEEERKYFTQEAAKAWNRLGKKKRTRYQNKYDKLIFDNKQKSLRPENKYMGVFDCNEN